MCLRSRAVEQKGRKIKKEPEQGENKRIEDPGLLLLKIETFYPPEKLLKQEDKQLKSLQEVPETDELH